MMSADTNGCDHALLVAPFWEWDRFHPHRRRVEQWVSVLRACGLKITLAALAPEAGRSTFPFFDVVAERHPRFVGDRHRILVAKSERQRLQITESIHCLVGRILRETPAGLSITCHPSLTHVTDCWIPRDRTIADLPDIPSGHSTIDGPQAPSGKPITDLLKDRWTTVLSSHERLQLRERGVPSERIVEAGPLLHACVDPAGVRPDAVCIFGRASTIAFDEMLVTLMDYIPQHIRQRMSLKVVICGEISRSLRSTNGVHVLGPAADLRNMLARRICILPPPIAGTGVSFRVLEIVEAGAYLVAATKAVRGYGLEVGHHYFAGDCPAEAQRSVARILSNPNEAAIVVRNAQAHLRVESRKTASRMRTLLNQTMKQ